MVMLKLGVVLVGAAATWGFSAAASAEPVKITNIGHGYYSGALYVAKQEKLFEKYGLDPDVSYVQGGALALQAVLTKQSDVSILSYEHILTAAAQGKRIVALYNLCNRPVNNVIANDKLSAGAEQLSIEAKIKHLKGARVAMPSAAGSGEKMLGVLARKYGVDAFNVGVNDGPAAGQTVAHAHIHVIPRRKGDAPDPRGGVRWIMPEKAKYW